MTSKVVRNQGQTTDRAIDKQARLPKVAILLAPAMCKQMLPAEAERQLASFASVVIPPGPALVAEDLPHLLDGAVACLTGWGTPPLSDELLTRCSDLRLLAHTA